MHVLCTTLITTSVQSWSELIQSGPNFPNLSLPLHVVGSQKSGKWDYLKLRQWTSAAENLNTLYTTLQLESELLIWSSMHDLAFSSTLSIIGLIHWHSQFGFVYALMKIWGLSVWEMLVSPLWMQGGAELSTSYLLMGWWPPPTRLPMWPASLVSMDSLR